MCIRDSGTVLLGSYEINASLGQSVLYSATLKGASALVRAVA